MSVRFDTARPRVRAFAPGRTELAGNHVDHQGGRVVAAAVSCGIEVTAQENGSNRVCVESAGFAPVDADASDVRVAASERFTTTALVKGMIAGLQELGVGVGGFDARVTSSVSAGGGLSSSAAFELSLGAALNMLFADGRIGPADMVRIAHRAERDWFGKPCGMMDQLAVQAGGICAFDFGGLARGGVAWESERLDFDFERCGYALCLIDTHCDHSRYVEAYSQVATDMVAVARFFGKRLLSQVPERDFFGSFKAVRAALGDAAALRGLHYYHEMRLVDERIRAMREGDVERFLDATRRSGASSAQYLQNVSTYDRARQPAMAALALADALLGGTGACRIHGGGFGGTVQAFVPVEQLDSFACALDGQLGEGSCRAYRIARQGAEAAWL